MIAVIYSDSSLPVCMHACVVRIYLYIEVCIVIVVVVLSSDSGGI